MIDVKVSIIRNNRKVGAMVKALAYDVAWPSSVKGASNEFLESHDYCTFHFPSNEKANEFKEALSTYLPALLATVVT